MNINVKLYDTSDKDNHILLSECNFIDEEPAQKYIDYYRELSYYLVVNKED